MNENNYEEDEKFIYIPGKQLPPNRIRFSLDSPVMKFFEDICEEEKIDE